MTLSPKQIGDKGQRFKAEYFEDDGDWCGTPVWHGIGYCTTREAAQRMCAAMKLRPGTTDTRIIDRHKEGGTVEEMHR